MNDFNIGFIGGLDGTKSKAKLNQDIDAIKKTLKELELKAKLDPNQVKSLETQLNTLKVNLTDAKFSQSALDGMVSQINNALKGIKIPNINVGGNAGQQIGNNIAQGFKQSATAIEAFKKSLSNAGKSSSEIDNIVKKVQSLNVQIDSLRFSESTNGLMNVNVAGLDEFGNKVKITQTLLQDLQSMQWNVSNTTTSVVSTKELERINNAFTDYTAKLAQFKSTNTNILSGLTQPLADFESKLAGLKNGTVSIDEVKNAFKLLGTEASKITENFTGQLSKTDAAIRKLAQGDEIMDKLKASFKGLNNAPKEITKELNSVSKLLQNVKNIESKEGRTANWSEAYRKWADEVDKLQAKLSVLQKQQASMTTPQIFKTSELKDAGIPYMQKVSNTIEKQMVEIQRMANREGWQKFEVKGIEEADGKIKALTLTVRDAEGALKQFAMQRAKLQGAGKAQDGLMQVGDVKVLETASQAQAKLAQQTENANAKLQEQFNKIQLSFDDGTYEAKYDSLIAKTRQWINANDESVISTQKLTTAYNEFNTAASNFAKDGSVKNRDILIQKEEELGRQLKATTNDIKVQNAEWAKSSKVDSLHQKIQEFYDKNTATHRQWGGQLQNLLNETAHGAQVTATRVNEIEQEYLGVVNASRQAGKLGQSFFGGMIEQAKKFANWVSVTTLLMRGFQELKQGVQFIKELDDALTDVAYTSNSSKSQLEDLGNSAVQMSKDLKASADNILEAVKIYSTAKSSADDILRKAQPAIMLSNISGMSGSESSKTINTALNQFELEDTEEGLLDITDTLQYVSSQLNYDFTEGIQQITEGLEASGSVAMNAGLSFQEYSAMVGLAVEKTGQAGSTIGQAYKTIFSRITKASATEGTLDEDISAAEKSLRSVGIQVRDSANEFRDLTDIMADLGKVWNSLSSVEKSNIGYNIAGIRQLNILNSLFGSWEDYASIMGDIDERTGTTLKNQEVYAESLAGHLGELEAVGQSVWNNIIQSETLKSGIDLLTGLLNIVDKTTDALGGLGTVGLAGGLLAGIKNVGQAKMWAC